MLRAICTAASAALIAGSAFAQTSDNVTIGGPPPPLVAEPATTPSRCDKLQGVDKVRCENEGNARVGNTGGRAAGAGGTHAPGSTGTGAGTMGAQNTAPSGSTR